MAHNHRPSRFRSEDEFRAIRKDLEHQHELLHQIKEGILLMSAEMDRLRQEVSETKTVAESATALINSLSQQIRDNAEDPEAMRQLADELDASQQTLGAAITANTPQAPDTGGGTTSPGTGDAGGGDTGNDGSPPPDVSDVEPDDGSEPPVSG